MVTSIIQRCVVCGLPCDESVPTESERWCPGCGSALAKETLAPATQELAPNLWGDLLVLASLAVLAFLLHTMFWREF